MSTKPKKKFKRIAENLYVHEGGGYYAIVKVHGKQIWKCLEGVVDLNTAKAERDKVKAKIRKTEGLADRNSLPTFSEACTEVVDHCKRNGMKERCLESVKNHLDVASRSFLKDMKISAIRTSNLRAYLENRFANGKSGRTVNLDLVQLRRLFKFSVDEKRWRWDDPTEGIKQFPHKPREVPVPTVDQVKAVLKAFRTFPIKNGKKAANLIEFLFLSGLRIEESQEIKWSAVDLKANTLTVWGKGDKKRIIPLLPELRTFLIVLKSAENKPKDLIFSPRVGEGYDPRHSLRIACEAANVPRFAFHGLRHRWATRLREQGVDFGTIAEMLGHSDGGQLASKTYTVHSDLSFLQSAVKGIRINGESEIACGESIPQVEVAA